VDRAIEIVERALAKFGAPIYVRHEIVHNTYVVNDLKAKGAIFIEELDDVPPGATLVFSAHGVSKAVQDEARRRGFQIFDATCPLVTKVHVEVAKLHREGYEFIMIGHKGHPEVEGTMGQLDSGIHLVEDVPDVARVSPAQTDKLAVVTQTTLSVDDAAEILDAVKARFPSVREPKQQDICYATQNRQDAVKLLSPQPPARAGGEAGHAEPHGGQRRRDPGRVVRGQKPRGPDGGCLCARDPGAPGDRAHQGARRDLGAHDGRADRDHQVPAAQGPEDRRRRHQAAGTPALNARRARPGRKTTIAAC
jgi:(E)-4-hydroxy-3-methyl-but-2-enyl pyrophosphate reductase